MIAAIRFAMAAPLYDLGMTVMRQSWHDVSFLHWRYDPAVVRPLVPRGLELDLYDGAAWVGLVPFYITGLTLPTRPRFRTSRTSPRRTCAPTRRDRTGGRGVWFFSLDAARLLAVVGARAGYALPYFWSRMRVSCNGKTARYACERLHGPKASSDIEVAIGERIRGAERAGDLPDDAIPAVCRACGPDVEGGYRASAVAVAARERGGLRKPRSGRGAASARRRGA